MPLTITITDAGRAELINAQNTGTAPVEITHVALGDGGYTPDPTQSALQNEVARVSSIAGEVVAADTISVTAKDEGSAIYTVREFGLITEHGTLFAIYSQADPIIEKASPSTLLLTIDVILQNLDASSLTFGDITFSNPPASKTVAGVVRLSSSVTNTSENMAATPLAAKKAFDAASERLEKSANLADLGSTATARANLGLGAAATQGSTASRTSSSTMDLLQAKAMNDHRTSGDHDNRYVQQLLDALEILRNGDGGLIIRTGDNNGAFILQLQSSGGTARLTVSHDAPELKGDGSGWAVDGVALVDANRTLSTGAGLSGGGNLSTNRTLFIPNGGISLGMLQNWMITNEKISANAIESRAISDAALIARHFSNGCIPSSAFQSESVYAEHLGTGSAIRDWVWGRANDKANQLNSKGWSGRAMMPGGLMLQWGQASGNGDKWVPFNVNFPNSARRVFMMDTGGSRYSYGTNQQQASGFWARAPGNTWEAHWWAIGD
ncbi:phage tail protein [Halomonas sp. DP8Y7-3]|uniref:gp53-like domain-containing protein n=1 Tax=Halomonas sp. DP8Y7-3 TaxID=2859079 RepID=UPI001C97B27A|nr:phage tail protein [Halomonas sp. DP8Y7-3]MBY5930789.1 phage tail protein [Halomonas sp. DP8Y7-3]